jgi:hypothetical protein
VLLLAKSFFSKYELYVKNEQGIPQSLEEIEDDMHLKLFDEEFKIGDNSNVFMEDEEIFGENIFLQYSTDKKIDLDSKPLIGISNGYWKRDTKIQSEEKTWLLAKQISKKFVYNLPIDF